MGGLERSQKFLDVAKVGVCGKMQSLEVCTRMCTYTVCCVLLLPLGDGVNAGVVAAASVADDKVHST